MRDGYGFFYEIGKCSYYLALLAHVGTVSGMDGAYAVSGPCRIMRCVAAEDRDLHADLLAAYRQLARQEEVLREQTELICQLLDRRVIERRAEDGGLGAVRGIDRRRGERRDD